MAKATRKTTKTARKSTRTPRRSWTSSDERELKKHSKSKSPVDNIAKAMKRTAGAIRQKAMQIGIPVGHRR